MEEEDDVIHSLPPPSPSGHGGRIAATVASTTQLLPQPQQPQPKSQPRTTTTHRAGSGGREDCWSEGATGVLIDAWGEHYLELSRGNLKQKHWKEVAELVSSRDNHSKTPKTDIQCKNRIDTVKKKYKLEKARIASGGAASKWVFFDKLDRLIGPTAKTSKIPIGIPVRASSNANLNASNQSFDRKNQMSQLQIHKKRTQPVVAGMETEEEDDATSSPDSADSLPPLPPPPPPRPVKKRRTAVEAGVRRGEEVRERGKWRRRKRRRRTDEVRELTQAILRFGEMYEKVESAKLMQMVEMEKQRMKFVKELELQKTQFFVKTQLEISQLKVKATRRRRRKRKGGGSNSNGNQFHNCNDDVDNDNNDVNDNNSDSSN